MTTPFELINSKFVFLFIINSIALLTLLRGIYYRFTPNRDFLFGLFLFGSGVFLITNLLHDVEMSMGFAFGLFAVFSMLRYRTESISIRDMTYLFLVIVIALMSAVAPVTGLELIVLAALVCSITFIAETKFFAPRVHEKRVIYENIDNIKIEKRDVLIQDLNKRTGLVITKVDVVSIDFLRDVAELRVFYQESDQDTASESYPAPGAVTRYEVRE